MGNLTSDGGRSFDYDSANRLAQVKLQHYGEEAAIAYLHNAQGQRVFKGEPRVLNYQPSEARLGAPFTAWLKENFAWLWKNRISLWGQVLQKNIVQATFRHGHATLF